MTGRQFSLLLICCMAAAFVGGAAMTLLTVDVDPVYAQQDRVVQAGKFQLVDRNGNERAVLEVQENGFAGIFFNNAFGEQLILGQHVDGREVLRMIGKTKPRAVLRAHRDGMSQLTMFGNDGKSAAIMAVYDNGELLLGLRDKSGETSWKKP